MITKIQLKEVASYGKDPAILETDKKINFIYGLNGTGKTTISKYLQNQSDSAFSNCSIDGLNNEKIFVYNQKFVDDNFHQDTQKGIFSLNSENKEAKVKIEKATEEISKLNKQIKDDELKTGFQFDLENKQKDIDSLQNNTEAKTWEIKTKYSSVDKILEFCLEGKMRSKKDLFDHILKLQKLENKPEKTIENLTKEAKETQGVDAKIYDENFIKKIFFDFWKTEEKEIFKEIIIGNENSQIAELIKKLNHSDWVKKGKEFITEPQTENDICPFCQQRTISKDLYTEIQNYFDETYQTKITELGSLDKEYFREYQNVKELESQLLLVDFIKVKEAKFALLFKSFINKISNNWLKINDKIKSPNIVVVLESSILEQKALNDFLNSIIEETKIHNDKVQNQQKTKSQIIKDFWEIMRWEYDQTIENYQIQKIKLENEKNDIVIKITELNIKITEQKKIIEKAQSETETIQDAIDNINDELIFFGLDGFFIEPVGDKEYKLKRPNENITEFKTLSEGEKTVISFLYFLERCKGKEKDEEVVIEKIVVIDDPISSLSHMYVFNVAQLIKKNFFNDNYKQIFILTHNLYLFHELIKYTEKNKKNDKEKLFRITKNSKKDSIIFEIDRDEIMNDYQSYWQVIKEHDQRKSSDSLLANSMRNILEYFFGFIDNEKYEKAIEKLKDGKYSYFLRYINRESHFDRINISDTKEIDPQIFKEAFKKIFENSEYVQHYNKMMGIESD